MDKKELSLINGLHSKLINREFDENDIYSLLILLRSHSRKHSPLHEISDFIAHREKDRGKIHSYLSRSRKEIIKMTKQQGYRLNIQEIFSEKNFVASINEVFNKNNLEEINDEIGSAIMLCTMSLLQDVRLFEKKKEIASLELSFPSNEGNITLHCKIPIKRSAGDGVSYIGFAVLRTTHKPSDYPRKDDDNTMYKIINRNKAMSVQEENNG